LPITITLVGLSRFILPILFKFPVIPLFLRPFMGHFTKGYVLLQPWKHVPTVMRGWGLAASTITTWEFAEILFDTQIAQPVPCSHLSDIDLVAGASSSDRLFQYFALRELEQVASSKEASAAARRSTIFADQKHSPNMWSQLLRNTLLLLGNDYQHLLRRGLPPLPAVAPVAAAPAKTSPMPATPVKVGLKPIYKPSPSDNSPLRQVINSLASDGNIPRAVDELGASDLIKKVEGTVEASAAPAVSAVVPAKKDITSTVSGKVHNTVQSLRKHVPFIDVVGEITKECTKWYTAPRIDKEAEMILWMKEIDLTAVEGTSSLYSNRSPLLRRFTVLSHLTCASLKEDTYGVVQRDIPRILEAFVSFLEAAEAYRAEVVSREGDETEKAKARDTVDGFCEGLRVAIRRIVQTFDGKLTAFKFPPKVASRLQNFVDYL
jgi:nucleoporin NDC1